MQDFAYPGYSAIDYSFLVNAQLETALQVLINSIAASSTLNTWDDVYVDIFTDADGADNTIDTGNTTAVLAASAYTNSGESAPQTDAHGVGASNSEAHTKKSWYQITPSANIKLKTITKAAADTATKAYLYSDSADTPNAELASAAIAGNNATFDYNLSSGVKYWVGVDKEGASRTMKYQGSMSGSFPIVETNFSWTRCMYGDQDWYSSHGLLSIETTSATGGDGSNKLIQSNMITIDADPLGHQVYCHNSTSGTGNINYNISFDNGVTWETAQPLNQKNEDVHVGTQMILKLNLNGVGAGNIASADDYGVLLYY